MITRFEYKILRKIDNYCNDIHRVDMPVSKVIDGYSSTDPLVDNELLITRLGDRKKPNRYTYNYVRLSPEGLNAINTYKAERNQELLYRTIFATVIPITVSLITAFLVSVFVK